MPDTFKQALARKSVNSFQRQVVGDVTRWTNLAKLWFEQEALLCTAADVIALARLFRDEETEIVRQCREDEQNHVCGFCDDDEVPDGVRPS